MYQRLYFLSLGSPQVHFLKCKNVRAIPPGTISHEQFKEITRRVKGQQLPIWAVIKQMQTPGVESLSFWEKEGIPSQAQTLPLQGMQSASTLTCCQPREHFYFSDSLRMQTTVFLVVLTALLPLRYRCVATEPNQITPIYIFIKSPVKSPINCCCYI